MARCQFRCSFANTQKLPLILQAETTKQANVNGLVQFLTDDNPIFKDWLLRYGVILFRGFHVNTPDEFLACIQASALGPHYNYDFCPVPRTKLREGVFTSSEFPARYNLALHNEKSYSSEFPSHIFFNCNIAPKSGGQTSLANGHKIWLSLPEFLQQKLQTQGILYRKHYYGNGLTYKIILLLAKNPVYKTWMDEFQTNDKHTVEQLLAKSGEQILWKGNDLITEKYLPAFYIHPVSGKIVWFNQSNQLASHCNAVNDYVEEITKNVLIRHILLHRSLHPHMAYYGNGKSISKKDSCYISQAFQKNTVLHAWQPGDLMIIDNYACLHGKTPHTGNRLILAGMTRHTYQKANSHD
ncbi:TauD/TfdA family dioxygenase [Legionella spiritensis]|uniref:TauD/TfdA family dioxygenase n=1 Tax=Legionella spiritensis TaxID=452 RepID=UPI000F6BD33E|nr:TauD/TfdA family dioxygenase [Legionella spiritensis]VEG91944.1 pyoverdine biosynthesis regulatory protein SyrP-like [Legionella spiritensis]